MRPLPEVTPENEFFWKSGADGLLRMQACSACDGLVHPPQPFCRRCGGELAIRALSGRGTIVAVTVNHQPWSPSLPPPYALILVALDEDPLVRLTSLAVDVAVEDVAIGQRVEVRFEEHEDVWLPVFAPIDEPIDQRESWPEPAMAPPPARATGEKFESKVALTGIGMSKVGRRLGVPPLALTVAACREALDDAGLDFDDIDGLATYPGGMPGGSGMTEGGVSALMEALPIQPTWISSGMETPGQGGSIVNAMLAVASGLCRHVLCFRTVWEATAAARANRGSGGIASGRRVGGDQQWRLPYGAMSAANWIALQASHYMNRFGMTREQLGWIPVVERGHAAKNPSAIYRDPMSLEDYLGARMITTPFGLYDCDVPCDGAAAVIVSAVETAGDRPQPPVLVEAVGTHVSERISWDQGTLTHEPMVAGPGAHLWTRTDLTQADIDIACVYDGFSFNALSWIEALGFCKQGEGGAYIEGGTRIRAGGDFVLNPHGGQLSAGRLHGYGFFHEAVAQLRGQAGERQVGSAETAVVTTGGGTFGGAVLLRKS